MKVLVVGSNGQLGWELCRRGENKGFDIGVRDTDKQLNKSKKEDKRDLFLSCPLFATATSYSQELPDSS